MWREGERGGEEEGGSEGGEREGESEEEGECGDIQSTGAQEAVLSEEVRRVY